MPRYTRLWVGVNKKLSKNYNSFGYDLGIEVELPEDADMRAEIDTLTKKLETEVDARIREMARKGVK